MGLDNPVHILLLLIVLLLVFGARRLPEIGKSLGEGMRGFKDSLSGASNPHDTLNQSTAVQQPAPVPTPVAVPEPVAVQAPVAAPAPTEPVSTAFGDNK